MSSSRAPAGQGCRRVSSGEQVGHGYGWQSTATS